MSFIANMSLRPGSFGTIMHSGSTTINDGELESRTVFAESGSLHFPLLNRVQEFDVPPLATFWKIQGLRLRLGSS
ncbi:hypothetical protein V6N13_017276 [Hibiscus sabdariffa]